MTVPLTRHAARVLLVDGAGRVLLFLGGDPDLPDGGSWWITPGGGLDEGETHREGAAREVLEETGLVLHPDDLGDVVLERQVEFRFAGTLYAQHERFFLARVGTHEVDTAGFSALEKRFVLDHRWWTLEDLRATDDQVFPEGLADLVARLTS